MSNAAGIKGFIGLPSLLNASGNARAPALVSQNVQFRTHEIVPQSGGVPPDDNLSLTHESL
jgi:hypothetical protein